MKMGIGREKSHGACSSTEIHPFFLHKCINNQRIVASCWLIFTVLPMLSFMIFASVLITFIKEWIFQGPYSTILEALLLYCVNGICFGVIDSLPFETPSVMVRTT